MILVLIETVLILSTLRLFVLKSLVLKSGLLLYLYIFIYTERSCIFTKTRPKSRIHLPPDIRLINSKVISLPNHASCFNIALEHQPLLLKIMLLLSIWHSLIVNTS